MRSQRSTAATGARRVPSAVALALALGSCTPDPSVDPLDPDVLADLARAGGDAEGDALSGRYAVVATPGGCDCPEQMGLDLCGPQFAALAGLTGAVDVTQASGYLTWIPVGGASLGMSGAIDRDGAFLLAAIYDLGSLLTAGDVYGRFEGSFTEGRHLAGALDLRVHGDLGAGPVDCRASFALTGEPAPAA